MKKYNLIFDFDGTLVDSFYTVIAKFSLLAEELHFQKINLNDAEKLRTLTSKELIKYLKIPFYKLPKVLRHAREHMRNEMPLLSAFDGLPDVLRALPDLNCSLGILTSNSSDNVEKWLERYEIKHLFTFIHAESSYFGKEHLLKKILKSHKMLLPQTFYIGDETRDIEAAKKCRINSISVSWGFNAEETLVRYKPDYLAIKPEDILTIIAKQV